METADSGSSVPTVTQQQLWTWPEHLLMPGTTLSSRGTGRY